MVTARETDRLPRVAMQAVGRAAAPTPARPPAVISHPPTVYTSSPVRVPVARTRLDGEESGSLTGDVLAPGDRHRPRSGLRILIVVLVVLLIVIILAVFGLTIAAATSEAVRSFFDGIVGG